MSKLNVTITGDSMEIYKYLREIGYGIKDAKVASKSPATINFDDFDAFTDCVKSFHRAGFIVETECDFETDLTHFAGANVLEEEEVEIMEDFTNEVHQENVKLVNAIIFWQTSDETPDLTCANDSTHTPLYAGIDTESNSVVLACKDCDYVQTDIPSAILSHYNEKKKEN